MKLLGTLKVDAVTKRAQNSWIRQTWKTRFGIRKHRKRLHHSQSAGTEVTSILQVQEEQTVVGFSNLNPYTERQKPLSGTHCRKCVSRLFGYGLTI